jgi:hypothetical protein
VQQALVLPAQLVQQEQTVQTGQMALPVQPVKLALPVLRELVSLGPQAQLVIQVRKVLQE